MFFEAKYKREYITKEICEKIETYWNWFLDNRTLIEEAIMNKDKSFIKLIEAKLMEIFISSKKTIPFALGYDNNRFKLFIYFGRNSYILTVGDELAEAMPKSLYGYWQVLIEK